MSDTERVSVPNDSLGLMSGLQGVMSFFAFGAKKETDHNAMMFEGYHQMLNGLSLFLQGAEVSLNKQIDFILDNEQASLTDEVYQIALELDGQLGPMLAMVASDEEMPTKLRTQLLAVRERLSMLLTLEHQFRPMPSIESKVMPSKRGEVLDFQKERDFKVGGWTEI